MKSLAKITLTLLILLSISTVFAQEFTKADITRHRIKSITMLDEQGVMKKVSHFNEHGDLVSTGTQAPAGLLKTKELVYNDHKLVTEEKNFNPLGNIHFTHRFSYNSKRQLVKKESIDGDNKVVATWNYEYDNDGKLVKEAQNSVQEGNNVTRYKYHKGKLTEEETTNETLGKEEKITFAYNGKNQLIEQKIKSYFTETTITITFTYNSKGKLIRQEEMSDAGKDGETVYDYDENGLLTRQTTRSSADNLTETTTYQIERF
jgi:antitoxin component YwqK of YwqJK toxin-antitoxin module